MLSRLEKFRELTTPGPVSLCKPFSIVHQRRHPPQRTAPDLEISLPCHSTDLLIDHLSGVIDSSGNTADTHDIKSKGKTRRERTEAPLAQAH